MICLYVLQCRFESEICSTVCLLCFNQLYLHFSHNKSFWSVLRCYRTFKIEQYKFRNSTTCTFICLTFISHTECSNAKRVDKSTTIILSATTGSWPSCRIHWLHHRKWERYPQLVSIYYAKPSDGEASVMLELWRMRSTSSLLLLPGTLWQRVIVPERVPYMSQIELN